MMSVYSAVIPRFPGTAMSEIKPRYEFRVWAETLTPIRERLERLAPPKETVSQETYLVSATTDKCNAKSAPTSWTSSYSSLKTAG